MVTCLADRASTKTCTLQQKGSGVQKAIYRRERKSLYFDFFKWKPWYWSVTCDCITVILRDSGCQSLSCWKHIACWAYKYPFYFPRKGGKAHLKKEFWHSQQSQPRHSVSQTATTIQKIGFVKNPIFPILSVKFNLAKQPTDKTAFLP